MDELLQGLIVLVLLFVAGGLGYWLGVATNEDREAEVFQRGWAAGYEAGCEETMLK